MMMDNPHERPRYVDDISTYSCMDVKLDVKHNVSKGPYSILQVNNNYENNKTCNCKPAIAIAAT